MVGKNIAFLNLWLYLHKGLLLLDVPVADVPNGLEDVGRGVEWEVVEFCEEEKFGADVVIVGFVGIFDEV